MYYGVVHALAETVLAYIRQHRLLAPGDRVGVAVSSGADSVGLLRLLLELRSELGIVLSVVHFNHRLRGPESDADQEFVANLARENGLEFFTGNDDVARHAEKKHISIEAAARELRYGFFRLLLGAALWEEHQGLKPSPTEAPERGPFDRFRANPKGPLFHVGLSTAEENPVRHGTSSGTDQGPLSHESPLLPKPGRRAPHDPHELIVSPKLTRLATGHTLDDQAETVLMRLIRGTGLRGLGGIHPRIVVENGEREISGEIIRPLLGVRRRELERYLRDLNQPWREDSTNADDHFTRNRVRKLVLPLLEKEFNPAVAENLSELAEIARDEEEYWENEISGWFGTTVQWSEPAWAPRSGLVQIESGFSEPEFSEPGSLAAHNTLARDDNREERSRSTAATNDNRVAELQSGIEAAPATALNASVHRAWLLTEPLAVQRRVIRAIADEARIPLEFSHVEEILHFAAEDGPSGKELSLPLGWKVRREPGTIVFLTPDLRSQERIPQDYEYDLPLPGRIAVPETGSVIETLRLPPQPDTSGYNPQHLLDAESVRGRLKVRNWRPGDRFWPAHTKSPKKIKELLQERHIAPPDRRLWPVVVDGDQIVWVRGFPVPAKLRARPGGSAVLIRETPFAEDSTA